MVRHNPKSGTYGGPNSSNQGGKRLDPGARGSVPMAEPDGHRSRPLRGGSRDFHLKLALLVVWAYPNDNPRKFSTQGPFFFRF